MRAHQGPDVRRLIALCGLGLEPVVAQELEALGAHSIVQRRAQVECRGDLALLYRGNLWLRAASRVLVPIGEAPCANADDLYRGIRAMPWPRLISPDQTLAVHAAARASWIRNTVWLAQRVKDAIVDAVRESVGTRPDVDVVDPVVRVHVRVAEGRAEVALDSSGAPLHERGWRSRGALAPLKETLGAGLLALAGVRPDVAFLDPMCGSGTLPVEHALRVLGRAPGERRRFACERWLGADPALWQRLRQDSRKAAPASLPLILGFDADRQAVEAATENVAAAGLDGVVRIELRPLAELEPPAPRGALVCNLPYGVRLGDEASLAPLYESLGSILKHRFGGWSAHLLTASAALAKKIGLRTETRTPVWNGDLECRLLGYALYERRSSPG